MSTEEDGKKEELRKKIEYQVACEERAFRIVERLIEDPIAEQMFLDCVSTVKRGTQTGVKTPLSKRPKIGFQDQLSLNAGQKYCRMLQGEHSAILSTFIRLPFVIKIFFCLLEWLFYTGFTG